jgi:hypothetical protein
MYIFSVTEHKNLKLRQFKLVTWKIAMRRKICFRKSIFKYQSNITSYVEGSDGT